MPAPFLVVAQYFRKTGSHFSARCSKNRRHAGAGRAKSGWCGAGVMTRAIEVDLVAAIIIATLMALWLAAAVAAVIIGLRREQVAKALAKDIRRHAALLDSAPALPMFVTPEGKISGNERIA